MRKLLYWIGYVSIAFFITGLVFKLQHWPGAAILMISGAFFFNFIALPIYLWRRFKLHLG